MIDISRAASHTVRASGPTQSSEKDSGMAPCRLTRPKVGFSPTTPQIAAGWRIEPPVSEPSAPKHSRAASAAAEPLDEPPQIWAGFQGFRAIPVKVFAPVGL